MKKLVAKLRAREEQMESAQSVLKERQAELDSTTQSIQGWQQKVSMPHLRFASPARKTSVVESGLNRNGNADTSTFLQELDNTTDHFPLFFFAQRCSIWWLQATIRPSWLSLEQLLVSSCLSLIP